MQGPASLSIGTSVSAKYKGAFCEAKVKSVVKQVKCRVTFKGSLGSITLSDQDIKSEGPLHMGDVVKARHPEKQDYLEAVINKIQDQSQYTVVFDDGDITSLRRNALCMKSGKHYNASESLDNLPLTHPEHFSTPVASGRRKRGGGGGQGDSDGAEFDSSASDYEETVSSGGGDQRALSTVSSDYMSSIGRVVCVENTDKKSSKAKETWFPALVVSPSASGTVKIDTNEEFLIRSFKDGRYYTVTKKDVNKFHRDAIKKAENTHVKEAMEKAIHYIDKGELPPHWDKDVLFTMGEDSTTESSETESLIDEEEDDESPEEKDHLVAELYKHMEDRGAPINKTPSIGNKDVDLYRLFRIVYKLGGHTRVSNNAMWRQVALKLGFETTWCINQVRVTYKRYLQSFEELYRTLGCTMRTHPRSRRSSGTAASSSRAVIRGKHRSGGGKIDSSPAPDMESDKSSISSQDEKLDSLVSDKLMMVEGKKEEEEEQLASKGGRQSRKEKEKQGKEKPKEAKTVKAAKEEAKMTTRPRRDSTSSLAAAMQVKAQKDNIGEDSGQQQRRAIVRMDRDKETENEAKKLQAKTPKAKEKESIREDARKKEEVKEVKKEDVVASPGMKGPGGKKKKKGGPAEKEPPPPTVQLAGADDKQHLEAKIVVIVGDKIKVFYKSNTIYEAKVIKVQERANYRWPRYLVHYQGWNARYDEWIERSRVAENLSWTKDREKIKFDKTAAVTSDNEEMPLKKESRRKEEKTQPTTATSTNKSSLRSKGKSGPVTKQISEPSPRATTPSSTSASRGNSRTGSPALKRQSSRSSIKKESEESDADDITPEEQEKARKSARLKPPPPTTVSTDQRRSSRKRPHKEESETEEVDIEKEDGSPSKPKRGRKAHTPKPEEAGGSEESKNVDVVTSSTRSSRTSATPSRAATRQSRGRKQRSDEELEEDPYAFKEPEPFDEKGKTNTPKKKEEDKKTSSSSAATPRVKRESDSTDSSSDETGKRSSRRTPKGGKVSSSSNTDADMTTSDSKQSGSSEEDEKMEAEADATKEVEEGREVETCKPSEKETKKEEEEENEEEEVKQEEEQVKEESGDLGKPVLQYSKKQQELFPFLSTIRTTTISGMASRNTTKPPSDPLVTPTKDNPVKSEAIEVTSPVLVTSARSNSRSQSPKSRLKSRKRKTPRKPNSSEIVESESESDSGTAPMPQSDEDNAATKRSNEKPAKSEAESKKSEKKKPLKKDDADDLDLACGETIPGSPVHPSSGPDPAASPSSSKSLKSGSTRLEMPFASVPESIHGPAHTGQPQPASNNTDMATTTVSASLPSSTKKPPFEEDHDPMDISSASQSPRVPPDGSKSPADSSEVDMDSLSGRKAESEDSRVDVQESKKLSSLKRKALGSPSQSAKRKRRPREASMRGGGRRGGGGRHGSGGRIARLDHEETDEAEEVKDPAIASLESLDNEALAALSHRSPGKSKYNFFVQLDDTMDSSERIAKIQASIEAIRKTYAKVKSDLAQLDRRRKKLKRREREKAEKASENQESQTVEANA